VLEGKSKIYVMSPCEYLGAGGGGANGPQDGSVEPD